MKGLILAGGTGSRLRPITHTTPKQLVPIANRPVLDYAVRDMRRAGVRELGVVVGNSGRRQIRRHLGDGSDFGVDVTYIVQGAPLGISHAVGCARDFVDDEPFVLHLGDVVVSDGFWSFVDAFDADTHDGSLLVQGVENPSRYGVVVTDGRGDVARIVEKPTDPPNDQVAVGLFIFTSQVFDAIDRIDPSWRGELEITDAVQALVDGGRRVAVQTLQGWWQDTGKPQDMLQTNRLMLQDLQHDVRGSVADGASVTGPVELAEGAEVQSGAVVEGPVTIAEGTTVGSGAHVGPHASIGPDCLIEDAQVESSIIVGETEITCDRKLVHSLIGRSTTISAHKTSGDQLVVGENTTLEL